MAITYSFADEVLYGTDDINNITRRICGAGIAPFASKESYNTSDLNALTAAVTEQGVSLDGCLCSVRTENGENIITVAQGIVFFQNGAVLEVDADGYELNLPIGSAGYVYAYSSPALQMGEILFAETLPTDGFSVPLAQVRADNTLKDSRSFACSKVATVGKNLMRTFEMEECSPPEKYTEVSYIVQKLPGVDLSKFNYGVLTATNAVDGSFKYFPERGHYGAFFDIAQGKQTLRYEADSEGSSITGESYFYSRNLGYGNSYHYVRIISGELCVVCHYASEKDVGKSKAMNCSVCLM